MFNYQAKARVLKIDNNEKIEFPNYGEISFEFKPLQPFGMESGGGKTSVLKEETRIIFKANSGHCYVECFNPLQPLKVYFEESNQKIELDGNKLYFKTYFESLIELDTILQLMTYYFPILLNVEFIDPPYVETVTGKIGNVNFTWIINEVGFNFDLITQEIQENRVEYMIKNFDLINSKNNQRLTAALHYFHIGCRLARIGNTPWEFMSEIILNFSKILEVLFPANKTSESREAIRISLKNLGYNETQIENNFIPAMCLRNNLDSGHATIASCNQKQRMILHKYTEFAESEFRKLLKSIIEKNLNKEYTIAEYKDKGIKKEAEKTISKIAENLNIEL